MDEQIKFSVFTAEQDKEKVEQIVNKIMPFLKCATINQIQMAFDMCLENIRLCHVIT